MQSFRTALLLTIWVFAVGAAWGTPLRSVFLRNSGGMRHPAAGAAALLAGLTVSLAAALLLGEFGLFRTPFLESAFLLAFLAGVVLTRFFRPPAPC